MRRPRKEGRLSPPHHIALPLPQFLYGQSVGRDHSHHRHMGMFAYAAFEMLTWFKIKAISMKPVSEKCRLRDQVNNKQKLYHQLHQMYYCRCRRHTLLSSKWLIFEHFFSLKGIKIRGLLLCNPNNPLGVIYSKKLLEGCLQFAAR